MFWRMDGARGGEGRRDRRWCAKINPNERAESRDHDAAMRISGQAPGSETNLCNGESQASSGTPLPRIMIGHSTGHRECRYCFVLLSSFVRQPAVRITIASGISPIVV